MARARLEHLSGYSQEASREGNREASYQQALVDYLSVRRHEFVPERWRLLYSLNPMVGVVEGFRWAFLGKAGPDLAAMLASTAVVVVLFGAGIVYFTRLEPTFADFI